MKYNSKNLVWILPWKTWNLITAANICVVVTYEKWRAGFQRRCHTPTKICLKLINT
jgi:hypothetical protein